jgi:nucleoside-diphosphate-sugar epimerase
LAQERTPWVDEVSLLDADFKQAFTPTEKVFPAHLLKDSQIFLTGGTGFFGAWLIESFLWLKKTHGLDGLKLSILSRNPAAFAARFPELMSRLNSIDFIQGDVCDFEFPAGKFSHITHAATPVTDKTFSNEELVRIIDLGTARVLEFAKQKNIQNLLFTSSGAIYGPQPQKLELMPETNPASLDVSAYGTGKKLAEARCLKAHKERGLNAVIARCYAFIGPYLAADSHLAVASFTRDAIQGKPIKITGNGQTQRSYLYGADLSAWLWNLLLRGHAAHPYNVGSERAFSLLNVAQEFARQVGTSVEVQSSIEGKPDRYIPSVQRAKDELGLQETFDLASAIERTLHWNRGKVSHV